MKIFVRIFAFIVFLGVQIGASAHSWTLQECIDYAMKHNISIRKTQLNRLSAYEDYMQSRSALLPSLSASTSHNGTFRPFPENSSGIVSNGYVQSGVDKFYYNGSYGVTGSWTVWDGNRNINQRKLSEKAYIQAELDSAVTANSIQEQIVQLYVQILYSSEAISVHESNLETSRKNEERGQQFVEVGKMSRADLSQLVAQRAQDEYDLVEAQSNLRNYKRQLKQLLQICDDSEFDVSVPSATDEMALQELPLLQSVYAEAYEHRPEIKNALVGIDMSNLSIAMAKAQRLPTVSLNASAITNTSSLAERSWGTQIKNNFSQYIGLNLNIPIFNRFSTRNRINSARIDRENQQLKLENVKKTLYKEIQQVYYNAVAADSKYHSSEAAVQSSKDAFSLMQAKYENGKANITEFNESKNNYLKAESDLVQARYENLYQQALLDFYRGRELNF